jgi:alpha-tubulin suppressor-like RCC1 family protein
MRRILAAVAVVVLGSLVSVASPAQAASGPWSVVSAGAFHTCAINTGKSLYCWGFNGNGQVGDGTIGIERPSPTKVGSSGVWASVSAGGYHTCAISTGKSLYCWGFNFHGQVGDGNAPTDRLTPRKIGSSGVWAGVAAGGAHTCAISTGNSLYCWGDNAQGQVGDGNAPTDRLTPRKVGSSGVWAGSAAGDSHTCAVTTGKSLYCWGLNGDGQVGDGTTDPRPSPTKVGSSGVWALADAGGGQTCAISTGKSLYCWGSNIYGAIGDGTTDDPRPFPKRIGASGAWARVSAGGESIFSHTCATTTGNSLYCWGYNDSGQVGDGNAPTNRLSPKRIGSSGVWAGAGAGAYHSCAISIGKSLYCWGNNNSGQIGDGTIGADRPSPTKIP